MTDHPWNSAVGVEPKPDAGRSLVSKAVNSAPNGVTSPAVESGSDWTWWWGDDRNMTEEGKSLFARRLKEARQAKRLTQAELSKATGIAQPDISLIERGQANITLDTMERLASAVGVPLHRLLTP